jgi:hypothetical protein
VRAIDKRRIIIGMGAIRMTSALASAFVAFACISYGCSSSDFGPPVDGGTVNPAGCPTSPPSSGGACSLFPGTTCSYGSGFACGGATSATCNNGKWTVTESGLVPGISSCPARVPTAGASCTPSCGGAQLSCDYGCDQGGPATATCNGTWRVQFAGISCQVEAGVGPPDASASDASTSDASDAPSD